jgi:hypothetical protein
MSTQQLAETVVETKTINKPEGAVLRKLHVLLRDVIKAGESMNLENDETAMTFGLQVARVQAMINGQIDVELPDRVKVTPINEAKGEKMRNRVRFFTTLDHARQAKEALKTAYQLNFMPSAMNVKGEPGVVSLSIYFARFTPAHRFFEAHRDIFIRIECNGVDAETPVE